MCFLEGGREALRNDWEEKSSGGAGEGREEHGGRGIRRGGTSGEEGRRERFRSPKKRHGDSSGGLTSP